MKKFNKSLMAAMVAAGLVASFGANATNGYFSHGYGTKSKGLAGGGSALPQDAMAAATNPAGMVFVGERMDLGVALFSPNPRGYTAGPSFGATFPLTAETVESDSDMFLIPHFARNWMLDADSSAGVTVYGNGGMNTAYPGSVNGGAGAFFGGAFGGNPQLGVNLEQLFINGSYAQKIDATSSWGASLIFAYQKFKADGLAGFGFAGGGGFDVSNDDTKLTDNGADASTGFGVKLGWQGEVSPGLTLAASYQSEMGMSEFDDYAGLFAEKGGFDIPATWTLGMAFETSPSSTLTLDVQNIAYSDVASIGNPMMPNLGACLGGGGAPGPTCLGGSNGAGFGWEDMTVYKLGYQWTTSPDWTWRAGVSITDQPIPDSEVLFNILAPGVVEEHFTFGFTNKTSSNTEFNFAAMYAPEVEVSGVNPLDGQDVTIRMKQYELEASWGWKF